MMTAFGYSAPKQKTKRTLIYEVAELLVEEKADVGCWLLVVCGGHEKLGKVTTSEVKRSNESQSGLKITKMPTSIR